MTSRPEVTLVFDVGKTSVKLAAVGRTGALLDFRTRASRVLPGPPYPHHDVEALFEWLLEAARELASRFEAREMVVTTHGATAALMAGDELVLPVLDYEYDIPDFDAEYEALARDFESTGSPRLPAGLNLGRQLFYLSRKFPEAFASATDVLLYPQYFAYRLSGIKTSEKTSLGCHTDLYCPTEDRFASWVENIGWRPRFPRLENAWTKVGALRPELAARTGLSPDTQILTGIHDSNASFFPYRAAKTPPFSVISTGTWVVILSAGASGKLVAEKDLLFNLDAFGDPVASSRFMGGREYAAIAGEAGLEVEPDFETASTLIRRGTWALPCFAHDGGPFREREGSIVGPSPTTPEERAALASLYAALMTDYCLDLLGAQGEAVIEGSFAKNQLLCGVLAAFRAPGKLSVSRDATGTTLGAAALARWQEGSSAAPDLVTCAPRELDGLLAYRREFRRLVA